MGLHALIGEKMDKRLNVIEYKYLKGEPFSARKKTYQEVGQYCFDEGWTDVFGFVTDEGKRKIKEYEEN